MVLEHPVRTIAVVAATASAISMGCRGAEVPCYTPLVLSFDGSAVEYVADHGATYFDLGQHDATLGTDWPTAKTPWLARDITGDAQIHDGTELFGSDTVLPDGRRAANGFQALGALDSDGDGRVGKSDAAWDSVLVWRDLNSDRRTGSGELQTASAAGILWIGLPHALRSSQNGAGLGLSTPSAPRCDADGNCEVERADFAYVDHDGQERRGAVVDIHLQSFNRGGLGAGSSSSGGYQSGERTCF